MNALHRLLAGALCLGFAAAALSQGSLPDPKTANGITYRTGGITEDESRALRKEARSWPLTLIFSEGRGHEYLADVRVDIKDGKGKGLIDVMTDGPILQARLPEGRYSVVAEWEGKAQKRSVTVKRGTPVQLSFNWPGPRGD